MLASTVMIISSLSCDSLLLLTGMASLTSRIQIT
jgi:hypothetical protein